MPESFGERLRQRRVEQAVSLAAIAEQTKIKQSLLEALERGDLSRWPGGIFRRAFIRAYALAIGLDPDVIVREFVALYPDPDEVTLLASTVASADHALGGGPPTRLRYLVGSALGSLSGLRHTAPLGDVPPAPRTDVAPVSPPAVTADARLDVAVPAEPLSAPEASMLFAVAGPVETPPGKHVDFQALALVCTELGRTESTEDVQALLEDAATILEATGMIAWIWDSRTMALRAASLAFGYSDKVLAQLPPVRREADNVTAAAFRSGQLCTINGGGQQTSAALAAPLMTPWGCAGVLAIELPNGNEQHAPVRAAVTILAAQLSQLVGAALAVEVRTHADAPWKARA